ncbi:unnamed protein product [Knipowitschia caucasica]
MLCSQQLGFSGGLPGNYTLLSALSISCEPVVSATCRLLSSSLLQDNDVYDFRGDPPGAADPGSVSLLWVKIALCRGGSEVVPPAGSTLPFSRDSV